MPTTKEKRVEVWNTFFKLSRYHALAIKQRIDPKYVIKEQKYAGGTLNEEQSLSLQLVSWTLLALQSRESHLIEELREKKTITDVVANAVHHLGIKEQWAILPKLAQKKTIINFSRKAHQSVIKLDKLRNHLFHVNYDELLKKIPSINEALELFNDFVFAMEDMNVILQRHKKHHKRVLAIRVL